MKFNGKFGKDDNFIKQIDSIVFLWKGKSKSETTFANKIEILKNICAVWTNKLNSSKFLIN